MIRLIVIVGLLLSLSACGEKWYCWNHPHDLNCRTGGW